MNQIACILPSTVAVGSYNVTVTNGTVSAPVVAQVVANKVGLFTQDSTGGGLASVQNYISAGVVDLNRLTTGSVGGVTISPAKPGQPVIAYGTGLGGYAAGDNTASPAFDFRSTETIVAVVGGVTIPVDYAGRAGYAGEDQINFTLPSNIPTGCAVSSADFGERQAERAHVYLHRARCQFERLRHARFHYSAVAETRSGRNHHRRRFLDHAVLDNVFCRITAKFEFHRRRFQPAQRVPIGVRRSSERDPSSNPEAAR